MPVGLNDESRRKMRSVAYRTLIAVTVFHSLSAVGGGIGMVFFDGLSMPKSLLSTSPFTTFLLPGLNLALVTGGTQTVAAVRLLQHRPSALLWSTIAGFGMVIWIVIEVGFIKTANWMQAIYVTSGLLQLSLVFALLGVVAWLVSPVGPARLTS